MLMTEKGLSTTKRLIGGSYPVVEVKTPESCFLDNKRMKEKDCQKTKIGDYEDSIRRINQLFIDGTIEIADI